MKWDIIISHHWLHGTWIWLTVPSKTQWSHEKLLGFFVPKYMFNFQEYNSYNSVFLYWVIFVNLPSTTVTWGKKNCSGESASISLNCGQICGQISFISSFSLWCGQALPTARGAIPGLMVQCIIKIKINKPWKEWVDKEHSSHSGFPWCWTLTRKTS